MKKKLMKRILAVVCAAAIAVTQIPYGTLNTIYAAGVEEGTENPAEPTETPVEPTETPAEPTETPAEPTETPAEPTETPVEPTETPAEPTGTPAEPTGTPAEPTGTPAEPTGTPEDPTETPVDNTTPPVINGITGLDTAYVKETVTLTADITPGKDKDGNVADYSIEWSGDIKESSTGNTVEVDTSSAGTKTATLTVTQGDEVVTLSKSVDVKLKITYAASVTDLNETHYNDEISFSVPKMKGYKYKWTDTADGKETTIGNGTTVKYKVGKTGVEHTIRVYATKGETTITSEKLPFTPQDADFKDIEVLINGESESSYRNNLPDDKKLTADTRTVDGETMSYYFPGEDVARFIVFDRDKEGSVNVKLSNSDKYDYKIATKLEKFDGNDSPETTIDGSELDLSLKNIGKYTLTVTCVDKGNTTNSDTKTFVFLIRRALTIKRTKTPISKTSDGNTSIQPEGGNTYFTLGGNEAKCDNDATVDTSNLEYENALPGKGKQIIFSESEPYYKVTGLTKERVPFYYFGRVPSSLTGKITAVDLDEGSKTIDLTKNWDGNDKSLTSNKKAVGTVGLVGGAHFQNQYFNTKNAIIEAKNGASLIKDGVEYKFPDSNKGENEITDVYLKTKEGIVYGPFTVIYNFDDVLPTFKSINITSTQDNPVIPFAPKSKEVTSFTDDGALIITNGTVTIKELQGDDDKSGVNYETSGILVVKDTEDTEIPKTAAEIKDKAFASEVKIEDAGKYYVYIKLEDNAGNVNYMALDGHVLSDKEKPTAEFVFDQKQIGGPVGLTVTPKDDSAGIRSVELHVYDGIAKDGIGKENEYTLADVYTNVENKEIYTGTLDNRKTAPAGISVKLTDKGAEQSILVVVNDWAGNTTYYGLKNGKEFYEFKSVDNYRDNRTLDDVFSIYGDPKIAFSYTPDDEKAVVRNGEKIFIRRTGINVTFTDIPKSDVELKFSKTDSNGDTENLTYKFNSYDSSKHAYICPDALETDTDGEYSLEMATGADGEYSLVLTVPNLDGDKQIAVSGIDEFDETLNEENKTVYTDSFIKDGTAPKVKVTVDKDGAVEEEGVTEDEKTYYYGLSDGFTVEDTKCEDITITVDVEEEHWYDEDIPTLFITRKYFVTEKQADGTEEVVEKEETITLPDEKIDWMSEGNDNDLHSLEYTIKGKADHSADGVYTLNLSNERTNGVDGDINEKGVYINYYDYYVHNSVPDTGKKTCDYVESNDQDYTYVVDTIRPVAAYSVSVGNPKAYADDDAVYYNTDFTESFDITEINYNEKNITLTSYTLDRTDMVVKDDDVKVVEMPQKTFSEKHTEDGVYWYEISGTDLAGNALIFVNKENATEADIAAMDNATKKPEKPDPDTELPRFTSQWKVLDMTAPQVTYTITKLEDPTHSYVDDADYYNFEFIESFTVNEVNYLERLIGFDKTSLNGVVPEPVSHDTEDNHIYSVKINTEGEYQFTFSGTIETAGTDKTVGTDKAGNPIVVKKSTGATDNDPANGTGSYTTGKKIYDVTAPKLYVTDMTQPAGSVNVDGTTVYYNRQDVSTTFNVTDLYLDRKKVQTTVAYVNPDSYPSDGPNPVYIALSQTKAEEDPGPETELTLTATSKEEPFKGADGVYRFEIAGEDRAGNKLVNEKDFDENAYNNIIEYTYQDADRQQSGYWTYNKVIDTEAPTGTITIGSYYDADLESPAVLKVNYSEPYRSETSASGTVSARDKSPVRISYPITSTVSGTRGMDTIEYVHNQSSGFEMNGQQVFYLDITLTDRAGNVTGPIKTNSIYLDVEAPTVDQLAPTIQIVANANSSAHGPEGNPLFNSSVPFLIVVTDPNATAQSSGLDEITYEILVDGIVATTGTLKGKDALKFPAVGSKTYTDPTLDYSLTYNNNEVVADSSLNSNNIMIRVHASDHAQNKSQREYNFGIDIVSPTISVTYDNNDVQNERYFKADRTATIVVTERNFDPSRINVSTNGGSQSGWSFSNNGGNGDNDTWTSTVTYSSDGDYTFSVAGSDILGHEATDISYGGTAPQSFTVDKTVPVITISFDHTSGYQNSKYYNQTRTGTVQIQEHNFRSSDAKVSAPGTISRGDQPTASMGGWGDSGDSHSMNITFDQDGDYSISAEYTDLAGNPAVPVKSEDFTIDKTAPVIEFDKASVTDKKAYSGVIAPRLLFSDTNYDPNGVTFTLTGIKNSKGKDLRLTEVFNDETGYGGSISYENFANIKANDDIYTARGTITDRAGNTSEVSITFSVNRFGSTWDYNNDKTTEGLLFKYTNQEKNVFLREINPDEVTVQSVVLTHDSEIRNLEEGKDYKVTANTSEGWKEYVYEFLAENFENEGTYSIVVQTQDEANNINTNSSVKRDGGSDSVPLQYSVDKTNPYATLDGVDLEEKRYSQDSLPLFTRLFDNLSGVYKVEIFIYPTNSDDDDPARMIPKYAYENTEEKAELEEILQANNGEVPFEIGANNTPQNVRIVTYDAAGNMSETVLTSGETLAGEVLWEGVLVTRNIASQYFYNRPLFFGSLGALGAGGIFLFLFLKRRKKDEDKENAA